MSCTRLIWQLCKHHEAGGREIQAGACGCHTQQGDPKLCLPLEPLYHLVIEQKRSPCKVRIDLGTTWVLPTALSSPGLASQHDTHTSNRQLSLQILQQHIHTTECKAGGITSLAIRVEACRESMPPQSGHDCQ